MKVLENFKLENIKSTKDHIKYENYWVTRALEVFQYFLLKKFLFLEKKKDDLKGNIVKNFHAGKFWTQERKMLLHFQRPGDPSSGNLCQHSWALRLCFLVSY